MEAFFPFVGAQGTLSSPQDSGADTEAEPSQVLPLAHSSEEASEASLQSALWGRGTGSHPGQAPCKGLLSC
jgi:hypothetical protein